MTIRSLGWHVCIFQETKTIISPTFSKSFSYFFFVTHNWNIGVSFIDNSDPNKRKAGHWFISRIRRSDTITERDTGKTIRTTKSKIRNRSESTNYLISTIDVLIITITIRILMIFVGFWNTFRIRSAGAYWLMRFKRVRRYVITRVREDSDNGRIYHQQIQLRLQFFPDPAAAEKAIARVSGVAPQ